MTESEIERSAEAVLGAFALSTPLVDPFEIARLEGIRLIPGDYDGCFDSRIEAYANSGHLRFDLFYAEPSTHVRSEGRVRFSVGHELGHFYLPTHRRFLLSGRWHGSKTGFVSDRSTEREADQFSAALLMPRGALASLVRRHRAMSLSVLADLSDAFATSLTSTVIRYVQLGFEPCGVVLSENGRVLFSIGSPDFRAQGLGWIARGAPVPANSVTARMLALPGGGPGGNAGSVDAGVWFESRREQELWEEARVLGRTGQAISFLVLEGAEEDED